MYEVELKVQADHGPVRDCLDTLGATLVDTVKQEDTYYDAPDRSFAETDEALRVRCEHSNDETRVELTYKGPLIDEHSKTRTEAETRVASEQAIREILSGLGYEPAATVEKRRERYAFEECIVTLDDVSGLGEFVEVEYTADVTAVADVDSARERAISVLDSLELDADEQIRTSYLALLLAEQSKTS